jgi:hypothetical protein
LQLGHNLLGYFITAGGLFKRPLVINTVVVAGVAAGAPLLGPVFGLKGFITALALGNAAGLVAGTLLAARTIPAQLVARSSAIFAAAAGVSLGLLALRPAGAIPLGLAGAATLVVGAIAADRRGARIELQPVAEAR